MLQFFKWQNGISTINSFVLKVAIEKAKKRMPCN